MCVWEEGGGGKEEEQEEEQEQEKEEEEEEEEQEQEQEQEDEESQSNYQPNQFITSKLCVKMMTNLLKGSCAESFASHRQRTPKCPTKGPTK